MSPTRYGVVDTYCVAPGSGEDDLFKGLSLLHLPYNGCGNMAVVEGYSVAQLKVSSNGA